LNNARNGTDSDTATVRMITAASNNMDLG
jgi:hypothetical protein